MILDVIEEFLQGYETEEEMKDMHFSTYWIPPEWQENNDKIASKMPFTIK